MLLVILGFVAAAALIGAICGRAYERNVWQQRLLDQAGVLPSDRLVAKNHVADSRAAPTPEQEQFAQALDAIAVEVERIGEGQRFLTKLIAERNVRPGGARTPSPTPGLVRVPTPPA